MTHEQILRLAKDDDERHNFNCGGFALNVVEWLIPDEWNQNIQDWGMNADLFIHDVADIMTQEIDGLRLIAGLNEVQADEYPIIFRGERNGCDFHFMKRVDGQWWHKAGGCKAERISADKVFSGKWNDYFCCYDTDFVLFAKKE